MDLLDILIFNKLKQTKGGGGITPTGTITITENGETDVTNYATADVQVPQGITPTGTFEISANGTYNISQYENVEVNVLPYIELESITVAANQYIDVDFVPTANSKLEITGSYPNGYQGASNFLCGTGAYSATWATDPNSRFVTGVGNNEVYFGVANENRNEPLTSLTSKHTYFIDMKNKTYGYDETSFSASTVSFYNRDSIKFSLFARKFADNTVDGTGAKIFNRCKLYDNNVLIHDFIPVKRRIDLKVGVFDLVTNDFYFNNGTGTFVPGNEV